MSSVKKNLYLANSLEELKTHYAINNMDKTKTNIICASAQKLYQAAEMEYSHGDEEKCYVLYMKFLSLVFIIQKRPEMKTKSKLTQYLSSNSVNNALNMAEILSKNLEERYKQKKESLALATIESNNNNLSMKSLINELKSENDFDKCYFECKKLYDMMMDNSIGLLILDCRSRKDFNESKLIYDFYVNIPEDILSSGLSAGRIQTNLSDDDKRKWSARAIKDHVILLDWNTNTEELMAHTPIYILQQALLNYDPDVKYKSLVFLKGGFEDFILHYPTRCTNPHVKPPNILINNDVIIDDIEYPSINDIEMKDTSLFSNDPPTINRLTKPAALKIYNLEKTNVIEILEDEDKLTDKTLIVEKEILEAEKHWHDTKLNTEIAIDEKTKEKAENELKEIEYSILQLDSKKKDIEHKKNFVRLTLEEIGNKDIQKNDIIETNPEIQEIETSKRNQIQEKTEQVRKMKEETERWKLERKRKAAIINEAEQKRFISKEIDNMMIHNHTQEIPKIDRSSKPNYNTFNTERTNREFSPVLGSYTYRGITGLKNLGNTCYMNSIIQCLSNTLSLNEYLVKGVYKQHINKNSKTEGRIVEELAAVFKEIWLGKYKYIACKDLRYVIGQHQKMFRGSDQQDSHEFLTILIDWLHLDLQTIPIKPPPLNKLTSSDKAWLEYTKSKESLILQLFYGQIKSTVKCVVCNKESATYDSFSNLSLELPPIDGYCEINTCLDMYFNGERITGWNCPGCKQTRDAIKKLDISLLPPYLVIHFKRFYASSDSGATFRKRQTFINFPLTDLDMTKYVAKSVLRTAKIRPSRYNLYAISNHYGSIECGHYTAFAKNFSSQKWFKFDDHIVSSLDTNDIESSAAYILFYTISQN